MANPTSFNPTEAIIDFRLWFNDFLKKDIAQTIKKINVIITRQVAPFADKPAFFWTDDFDIGRKINPEEITNPMIPTRFEDLFYTLDQKLSNNPPAIFNTENANLTILFKITYGQNNIETTKSVTYPDREHPLEYLSDNDNQ